ncbi:hypothetical protein [Kamptonema formosum]|nr:hypothetical protein [Oscillatoria sp. PCC 10802]
MRKARIHYWPTGSLPFLFPRQGGRVCRPWSAAGDRSPPPAHPPDPFS